MVFERAPPVADLGEGPRPPLIEARRTETKFFGEPPSPPIISRSGSGTDLFKWKVYERATFLSKIVCKGVRGWTSRSGAFPRATSNNSLLLCFLALHFLTFYIVQAKKCTFIFCRVLLREKLKWNEFHRSTFIEVSLMAELNRNSADYIWPLGLKVTSYMQDT